MISRPQDLQLHANDARVVPSWLCSVEQLPFLLRSGWHGVGKPILVNLAQFCSGFSPPMSSDCVIVAIVAVRLRPKNILSSDVNIFARCIHTPFRQRKERVNHSGKAHGEPKELVLLFRVPVLLNSVGSFFSF